MNPRRLSFPLYVILLAFALAFVIGASVAIILTRPESNGLQVTVTYERLFEKWSGPLDGCIIYRFQDDDHPPQWHYFVRCETNDVLKSITTPPVEASPK